MLARVLVSITGAHDLGVGTFIRRGSRCRISGQAAGRPFRVVWGRDDAWIAPDAVGA